MVSKVTENDEKTIKQLKCKRCGYEWFPRVEKPAACPLCKSYFWNVD